MDNYLRSHLVSSRIADAQASAARHRLVSRGSLAVDAGPTGSPVGRIVGTLGLRLRLPHRPLTPGIDPR